MRQMSWEVVFFFFLVKGFHCKGAQFSSPHFLSFAFSPDFFLCGVVPNVYFNPTSWESNTTNGSDVQREMHVPLLFDATELICWIKYGYFSNFVSNSFYWEGTQCVLCFLVIHMVVILVNWTYLFLKRIGRIDLLCKN